VLIVALASGLDVADVMLSALRSPDGFSRHLMAAHTRIAAFGGMFLLMVFLEFLFDDCTFRWNPAGNRSRPGDYWREFFFRPSMFCDSENGTFWLCEPVSQ